MNSQVEKILYRKAALIFEELGFLMPQSDFCEPDSSDNPGASISFKGSFNGRLTVSLSGDIFSMLSANMLGQEEPVARQMQEDALREITNVICGNALPAIYGLHEIFHLEAPVFFDRIELVSESTDYSCVAGIAIPFEGGQANLFLYVENKALEYAVAGN
jgi:CheY-specific phosphatase CheX